MKIFVVQFQVPKFLERESTIAFGLTFKSLVIMGGLGLGLFFLYYLLPKFIFSPIAVLFGLVFIVFQFIKVQGQSLFEILVHFLSFSISPRVYFWRKKEGLMVLKAVKKKGDEDKIEKEMPLMFAPKSRIGTLKSKIDIGER